VWLGGRGGGVVEGVRGHCPGDSEKVLRVDQVDCEICKKKKMVDVTYWFLVFGL